MKTNIKKVLQKQGHLIYDFEGTSMLPLLVAGEDKVHIKKETNYGLFDVVLFEVRKGYYILHRIIGEKDGKFAIIGDNSKRVDFVAKEDILGKMVGYYKKDKYFEITSIEYKEYMRSYVYSKKDREALVLDSNNFYKTRLENAFYELLKPLFNKPINKNVFSILTLFEKSEFYSFACSRKAAHLVGLAISKYDVDFGEKINKSALKQLESAKMRYLISENAVNTISKLFGDAKIPHIFLKGSELRNKYPSPYLRVSNDIDVLVKEDDKEKASKILIDKLGGKFYAVTPHDTSYICEKIKMDVELHNAINTDLPIDLNCILKDPFKNAKVDEKNKYRFHLCDQDECIFHLAHFAKHLNGGDYWITMMSDTILLKEEIEKVSDAIKTARLDKFYSIINEIFDKAFNKKTLSKEASDFESFIFRSLSEIQISLQKGKYKNRFVYILYRIFPPYRYFYGTSKALQKCPILLPWFWIKRWFKAIFVKGHLIKNSKAEMEAYDNENKHNIEILYNAGLSDYIVKPENNKNRF